MADELEPVQQAFIADMSDYIEPIDDAAAKTEGFADVVKEAGETLSSLRDEAAEAGGSLDGLGASEDDATASTETLAEAYSRLRDEVYETNPGIDDATASLLAVSAAADEAGLSLEGYAAAAEEADHSSGSFWDAINRLNTDLRYMGKGDIVTVTRDVRGWSVAAGDAAEESAKLADGLGKVSLVAPVTEERLRTTGIEAAEAFTAGTSAIDDYRLKLFNLSQVLAPLSSDAEDAGQALAGIVGGAGEGGGEGGGAFLEFLAQAPEDILLVAGAVAGLGAALGAVLTEVGGLVGGAVAAGAGIGALAVLAVPSLEKIASSYEGISQAQAAYHAAVQLEDRDPSKDNLEAVATAAAKLKIAYADVPAAVRPALASLDELKTEYSSMAKAFEPDAFKIFNDGLKIANVLLPETKPLADAAAGAIGGLLTQLDKAIELVPGKTLRLGHLFGGVEPGAGSGGFQEFIQFLSKVSPGVITAVGEGLGHVADEFSKDMESFSKADYINAVNDAFHVLGGTLTVVTTAAHEFLRIWDDVNAAVRDAHNWFDTARHAVAEFGSDFNNVTKRMGTDEANWANDTRRDFDDARHAIANTWDTIRHDISSATDKINADVSRFGSEVEQDIVSAGHTIEHDWDTAWDHVVSFTRSIPGRILGALGNIGGLLVSAGERLIEGMISGIRDEAGSLVSAAEGVVGDAVSAAEHLLHIGSPSRVTWEHGRMMDQGWANGIIDNAHLVKSAVTSVLGGLPLGIAGGASAAPVHITVPITLTGGAALASPQQLQQLQQVVQEAILRYTQLNQGSGLFLPGRRS
jgi:sirohydrochlorin ferrochelatase